MMVSNGIYDMRQPVSVAGFAHGCEYLDGSFW